MSCRAHGEEESGRWMDGETEALRKSKALMHTRMHSMHANIRAHSEYIM